MANAEIEGVSEEYSRAVETAAKLLLGGALALYPLAVGALVLARLGVDRVPGSAGGPARSILVAPIGLMVVVSIVPTIVLNALLRR